MYLYLISQAKNSGYDTYDSAVVAAESTTEAQRTHPSKHRNPWDGRIINYDNWADPADVTVKLIGTALDGTEAGVICASFNAG